jgi:hypothetical protein
MDLWSSSFCVSLISTQRRRGENVSVLYGVGIINLIKVNAMIVIKSP